jgi:hypothetical protein
MGFLGGIAKGVGKGISKGANALKNAGESVVNTTVKAVTNPLDTVKAIPGVALNASLWLPHAAAQGGGAVLKAAGQVTGSEDLERVGNTMQDASSAIVKGGISNPIASVQVLGGAVLTATGAGTAIGVGMLARGTTGVLQSAVSEVVRPPAPIPSAMPLVGMGQQLRPPQGLPPPVMLRGHMDPAAPAAPSSGGGESFIQWLTRLVRELFD